MAASCSHEAALSIAIYHYYTGLPKLEVRSNPVEYLLYSWGRWGDGEMGRWIPTPNPSQEGNLGNVGRLKA
ncbi:MAG: hypothetical protein QNJ74_15300 [Trichodesmium sp. MO_231.B1]|nr:hypothetical protein [Trichodesmium sp. MO_231.B1]